MSDNHYVYPHIGKPSISSRKTRFSLVGGEGKERLVHTIRVCVSDFLGFRVYVIHIHTQNFISVLCTQTFIAVTRLYYPLATEDMYGSRAS